MGMGSTALFPVFCQSSPPICMQRSVSAASALLHLGLGFETRSAQNTALVQPSCAVSHPGGGGRLQISRGLFRQKGWRVMGCSWRVRVCLPCPGGIAGAFLVICFLMALVFLLLFRYVFWALAVWGVGMWLLSQGRKAFKAAADLCWCPLGSGSFLLLLGKWGEPSQGGSHAQLLLKEVSSSLP